MRTVDQALNRFPVGLGDFTTLGAELAPARTGNRTWVFTGDSITHGNVHTYGVRTWSEQFAQRLVELGHASDTVVNTGISGDTSVGTSSTLGVNTRFADRVGAYEPDVVVVMLGMNDAASQMGISQEIYVANLAEIVDKIRASGATPIWRPRTRSVPRGRSAREASTRPTCRACARWPPPSRWSSSAISPTG